MHPDGPVEKYLAENGYNLRSASKNLAQETRYELIHSLSVKYAITIIYYLYGYVFMFTIMYFSDDFLFLLRLCVTFYWDINIYLPCRSGKSIKNEK